MKISKANKRDKKRERKKNGMKVSGKSIFLIQEIQIRRANKLREKNKLDS